MDLLPDYYGFSGGYGYGRGSLPKEVKPLTLQEELKLSKEKEKLKEKESSRFNVNI